MAPLPRAECPVCEGEVAVRVNGALREHKDKRDALYGTGRNDEVPFCPGSGELLDELLSDRQNGTGGEPDQALLERIGDLDRRIRERCATSRRRDIDQAEDFHAFDRERGWELQGCEKVTEYLADPTIEIPYSSYRGMVQVYEELVEQRGISKERLATVKIYRLQIGLKKLREEGEDVDELIADAESLGLQDFKLKWRGPGGGHDEDDELEECPRCGTLVVPEKLRDREPVAA